MRCTSTRSTSSCTRPTHRSRCQEAKRRPPTSTRRSHETPSTSSGPARPCRRGSARFPSQIATLLAEGDGGDYGLHSEMFTDGCMQLHRAGKVTNARKGQYDGVSVTTFAFGSAELYAWLDDNDDRRVPTGRDRQRTGGDRRQQRHGHHQRRTRDRRPGAGRRRHHLRRPVQRDRRRRGLRGRRRARAVGPLADLPALDVREGRGAAVADRAVVRSWRRHHDAAPPCRRHRHRVRRCRTGGQDSPRAR